MTKRSLLVTVALTPAWLLATPAYSQAPADAAANASSAAYESTLGEIVVTATRRSENSQKTPAAITVVSGEVLAARGMVDTTGLTKLVPSSRIATGPTDGIIQAIIRGIGNDLAVPFVYEPIAINMNDAYVPRVASSMPLFDVNRVEVLPGPQGTLYGKSAIGGVINVSTNEPRQEFGLSLLGSRGNYEATHITGVLNAPLTDDLAIRVAGDIDDRKGFFTNGNGSRHSKAARVSLKYRPTEKLSVLVWSEYNKQRNRPAALVYVNPTVNNDPYDQPLIDPFGKVVSNALGHNRRDEYRAGAKVDFDLGGISISYIPTYLDFKADTVAVNINRFVFATHHLRHLTQELRFAGDITDKLSWLGGVYYENSKDLYNVGVNLTVPALPALGGFRGDFLSTSKGANFQLRYEATDALRLIAGGRYSSDTATPKQGISYARGAEVPFVDRSKKKWDNFDWKVAVEADIAPQSMVYANVQTAYSPGGYQSSPTVGGLKIPKQTMIGYAAGSKNRFLDSKLQVNVEGFLYNYKNYLLALVQGGLPITIPVPKVRSYGAELSVVFAPTSNTRFNVGVGLLNGELNNFVFNGVNLKGKKLPASPKTTITGGFEQKVDVADFGVVTFRADSTYNSGFYGEYTNSPRTRQRSYTRTDTSLTYAPVDGDWSISAYVRNIEDRINKTLIVLSGLPAPYGAVGGLDAPRTYGASFQWKFGNP